MQTRRLMAVGIVGLFGAGLCWLLGAADGQIIIRPGLRPAPQMEPGAPPAPSEGNPALISGIKLVEDTQLRDHINAARDALKDASKGVNKDNVFKDFNAAVTALQVVLDKKEDYYVKVKHLDERKQEKIRWTSVKFEANKLLGSMPPQGLDVYEVRFGGKARQLLDEAKQKGDRDLLADVAQRFLHTRAGYEANELLATYFLDRGQFFTAALRFEKLLELNSERAKLGPLTLAKAALAFRRAGKDYAAVWQRLETALRQQGGLQVGNEEISLAQLKQFLQDTPQPELASPNDWPLIRGNLTNTGQGNGSPPLLNLALWKPRSTVLVSNEVPDAPEERGKEAQRWLEEALKKQESLPNAPIMSGFFPIVVNNLLLYRTHADLRAVYLQDGQNQDGQPVKSGTLAWASIPFDASLSSLLVNSKVQVTIGNWLQQYINGPLNFSNFLYENSLLGTLSSDHRLVYTIDDLAVPPPSSIFGNNFRNGPQLPGFLETKHLVMQNSLHAYNLQTGKIAWRLGDHKVDDAFKDSHFLGTPLAVGGKLYVLNEKNTGPTGDAELRLVCIDPAKMVPPARPGEHRRPAIIEPIQTLAMVQEQNRITHDLSRHLNAVHLAFGEGILVCPTNAGEVLGIDLMTRSLAWSYPYRDKPPVTPPTQPFFRPVPRYLLSGEISANWKSTPPVIVDGKVVFTAPDAHSLHCINLRDGEPLWRHPREDNDLFLAGVINGKVLIVGKHRVRALNLADGSDAWNGSYVELGDFLPSGQGVPVKNLYYLPLAKKDKGEVLAIDVDRGLIKARNRTTIAEARPPGNLVFTQGAVLSVTPAEVMAYQQLTTRLAQANEAVQTDPKNPDKLVDRGELRLADGQVQAAVDDLHLALALKPSTELEPRIKQRLYEALSDLFQSDFGNASAKYLPEYRALCQLSDNREQERRLAKFFRIVGKGREEQGNLVDAFQMYRDFSALSINREGVASLDDQTHKIPTGVWFRGRVAAMIAKATPEQRQPLEKQIDREWQQVKASNDLGALRDFVDKFDVPFAVGRAARLHLADLIMERQERGAFLEAELSLRQLRSGGWAEDAALAGKALAALALLEEKKSTPDSMKQAAVYYREAASAFPSTPLRHGKTGADLFNELATDKRFLPYLEDSGTFWNQAKIGVREIQAGSLPAGLQGFVFQPEGELTPLVKNYRLVLDTANTANPTLRLVDLASNTVRWSQHLGTGQNHFHLFQILYQQGQTNPGYYPNARFRFFQVHGHLAVIQVGTVVYCLDLDNPRLLWQHKLVEENLAQPHMLLQQVMPEPDGNLVMIMHNQFNNQRVQVRIGQVGAVQASYVALVTQKGLVVLDPLRGTTLWSKSNIPSRTQVFGDDRHIFYVEVSDNGQTGTGRALRASDGERIDVADFGPQYASRLRLHGRQILAQEFAPQGFTLRLYDILLGKDLWRKTFEPQALALHADDPHLTGAIGPSGKVVLLEVPSGRELFQASVVSPESRVRPDDLKNLSKPLLLRDRDRFYVALNQPLDAAKIQGGLLANNFSNGLRCTLVNGWFVAFHANKGMGKDGRAFQPGDMAWHSAYPITNQMVVLEHFQDLPILLFSARYNELINGGAGGNRWVSNTVSLHRATGKLIYDPPARGSNMMAQFYALNVDHRAGTINMLGINGTVQHYVDDGRKLSIDASGGGVPPASAGAESAQTGMPAFLPAAMPNRPRLAPGARILVPQPAPLPQR